MTEYETPKVENGHLTFYGMEHLVSHAIKVGRGVRSIESRWNYGGGEWVNGRATSVDQCVEWSRDGWEEGLVSAMPIADEALTFVEQEHPFRTFNSYHDVSGSEVDVGRFLAGIPESMVEYEPITVSRQGRIITLCASVCFSGYYEASEIMKRGACIVGLALALERLGHETELWADISGRDSREKIRVLVKGCHDVTDPEHIAYAFAHPSPLRLFAHAIWGHGVMPTNPIENLGEGTIYLPASISSVDTNPRAFITRELTKLGLIENEGMLR